MRKAGILFLAAALALSPASVALARPATRTAALLVTFPAGGDEMCAAVRDLLVRAANAEAAARDAATIVALAKDANPEQKAAIACGLIGALRDLDKSDRDRARAVRAALRDLDPVTRAIMAALQSQIYAGQEWLGRGDMPFYPGAIGGFASGGGATWPGAGSVSPN